MEKAYQMRISDYPTAPVYPTIKNERITGAILFALHKHYPACFSIAHLGKVRIKPRTALAYGQIRVQGIQLQQGGLPFKAQYHSHRVCPKAPKGEAESPICLVAALAKDSGH
ncbi:MAG: hypothetical protein LPH19_14850 [Shewanella sp.]|nr:hypothetical protein [Shewanella sp.]